MGNGATLSGNVQELLESISSVTGISVSHLLLDPRVDIAVGPGNFHELARRSGLSRSTVSGVLQGKRGASLETLRKLSEASGVELGRLTEYVEGQRQQWKGRVSK